MLGISGRFWEVSARWFCCCLALLAIPSFCFNLAEELLLEHLQFCWNIFPGTSFYSKMHLQVFLNRFSVPSAFPPRIARHCTCIFKNMCRCFRSLCLRQSINIRLYECSHRLKQTWKTKKNLLKSMLVRAFYAFSRFCHLSCAFCSTHYPGLLLNQVCVEPETWRKPISWHWQNGSFLLVCVDELIQR